MWIRSQNRKILTNVNEVLICTMDDNKYFIEGFWDKGSDTLGIYSSKEKAMRMLDEIENQLNEFDLKGTVVYQMPQDEDVKI